MSHTSTQVGNVSYNAAEKQFEALVTFHTSDGKVRIESHYDAPLHVDHSTIVRGLLADAMRARTAPDRLRSRMVPIKAEAQRTADTRQSSIARNGLHWLALLTGRRAA